MNKIELKEFYNKLKLELESNQKGIAGAIDSIKYLLKDTNIDIKIDSLSHEMERDNYILLTYLKDFLSVTTLEVDQIEEIREEYSEYEYILPTSDINIFASEEELAIYQIVEIYLKDGDSDIYKARLH